MSALGSVFLGDLQRHRVLSSPPSSPPPASTFSGTAMPTVVQEDVLESPDGTESPTNTPPGDIPAQTPPTIDPALSLELRLRWLEALLLGVRPDRKREKPLELKPGETLVHLAGDVQRRLTATVDANDGLKKFMHHYDRHAPWLTPASGTTEGMDADALEALLAEMELDVRAADRDMREIGLLEEKGVLSAGKLADYEALQPRLQALLAAQEQDMRLVAALEKRIGALVERHVTHVDTLSELFVAWDDVLTETEGKVRVLERDKEEQRRLGYT